MQEKTPRGIVLSARRGWNFSPLQRMLEGKSSKARVKAWGLANPEKRREQCRHWRSKQKQIGCKSGEATCAGCGKPISPRNVYCSRSCYDQNRKPKPKHNVAIGQRFERLTVTSINGPLLTLVCDCGKPTTLRATRVVCGRVKSCGCHVESVWDSLRGHGPSQAWLRWNKHVEFSAKVRNLEYSLSLDQVKHLCSMNCTYCGAAPRVWMNYANEYVRALRKRGAVPKPEIAAEKIIYLNGLDRVDSNLGYTPDNVVPCCPTCNYAKSDTPLEDFRNWIRKVYLHLWKEPA